MILLPFSHSLWKDDHLFILCPGGGGSGEVPLWRSEGSLHSMWKSVLSFCHCVLAQFIRPSWHTQGVVEGGLELLLLLFNIFYWSTPLQQWSPPFIPFHPFITFRFHCLYLPLLLLLLPLPHSFSLYTPWEFKAYTSSNRAVGANCCPQLTNQSPPCCLPHSSQRLLELPDCPTCASVYVSTTRYLSIP